jgi:predicted Zn finger-like uncharacterized protein
LEGLVVIRCERCSTLYELDEALLSPGGSQVQCTRCQHVFLAHPPRAAGRTLAGVPPQPAFEAAAPERRPSTASAEAKPAPAAAEAPTVPAEPPPARREPRAVRTGPPPVYRPSTPVVPPTGGRAALLKRDTVGAFESRLRWSARWRWLAPVLAGAVAVIAVAAWLFLARRGGPDAALARSEAMPLLAQDDAASLEQGIARLDAALRRGPQHRSVASEHALAYVLRAASLVEEGEGLAAAAAAKAAERERLVREQPGGWEESARASGADAQRLEAEVRAREEQARALADAALQALKKLQPAAGDGPELARGLAAYYALGGERDRARKVIRAARERTPADPWLDLAEAWVDARDPDRAVRERALIELGTLSVAHPELMRARYLLARTQAALGRRSEAVDTLDALLGANGRHEPAKRLREQLAAAPAPAASPPPALPESLPSAPPPVPQRRKLVTHTVPAASPIPSVTVLPPLVPPSEPQDARPSRRATPARASAAPADARPVPPEAGPPPPSAGAGAPAGSDAEDAPAPESAPPREPEPSPPSDGG